MNKSIFDTRAFGPLIAGLIDGQRLPELGASKPNAAARAALQSLTVEKLFPAGVRDRDVANCCLAALWLHHDFLGESHEISQEIKTPTGSYWHGIMHRREPDADNAKYWFRRVRSNPIHPMLFDAARQLGYKTTKKVWDAEEFVDFCEAERGTGTDSEMVLRRVQLLEWQLLFDWCWKQAA